MATLIEKFLRLFAEHQVDCILIGGWAATLHGSMRSTVDIDFVYSREPSNIVRLAQSLSSLSPYLRGVPPGLPFRFDERTIRNGLNFTLTTTVGDLDLFAEIPGGRTYEELLPFTLLVPLYGVDCRCVALERLIQLKRAAGRAKDLEAISELQTLLEERDSAGDGSQTMN